MSVVARSVVERRRWRQIGTNVDVVVSGGGVDAASAMVCATIADADRAFSRLREDSELSIVNASRGRRTRISSLFALAVQAALGAAAATDGLVDPSVGRAVRVAGYDGDFGDMQ